MEQKKYKQINTKTPEIQEMILSYQIGGVAYELSQRLEISPALALDLFYRSKATSYPTPREAHGCIPRAMATSPSKISFTRSREGTKPQVLH